MIRSEGFYMKIVSGLLFALLLSCSTAVVSSQEYKEQPPRQYVAHKAVDPIVIDGKGDENSWKNSDWSQDFIDIEGGMTPAYKTNVKMLWDDEYLYFYAEMEEPHVWGTLKERDTIIFYNNDFEIFIDPDGDGHNYYEYEMNALNTVWDLLIVKPYRDKSPIVYNWDINGLKSAVHIDGTLNNSSDQDKGWSVEIAMPWSVLVEANKHDKVPVNEFWRVNFSRVNWDFDLTDGRYSRKKDDQGKFLPEYNWVWSPQYVINMHEPEKWGYVYFSDEKPGSKTEFNIPQDEKIKWLLFTLFRNQRKYHGKHQKYTTDAKDLYNGPIMVDGKVVEPKIELHQTGWNISVISPYTGDTLVIKEDGKFIKLSK